VEIQFAGAELFFRVMGEGLPAVRLLAALVLALLLSLWWLVPWSRMALNLTEAEIHMLAPMPVKRRHLIQYATLKGQPGILFGCLMMTVFLGTGGPVPRLVWFLSFWLVLSLWDLHSKGRALWLERQKEIPIGRAWRNRGLLVVAIAAFWIVVGSALLSLVGELMTLNLAPEEELGDFEAVAGFVRQTLARVGPEVQSGVLGWVLLPFVWATAPLFIQAPGTSGGQQLAAVLIPVGLLLVHNEWVVRSRVKFEEAALAHARREADKKATGARYWKKSLKSRRRTPFELAPRGVPELGILWKNSMIVTRFSYRSLALFAVAILAVAVFLVLALAAYNPPWLVPPVPFILMAVGFMTMLVAPLTASQGYRNDFRADLLRIEMVRPWPIEGWRLFAAEAAGPVVFSTMTTLFGAALFLAMDLAITIDRMTINSAAASEARIAPQDAAAYLSVPPVLVVPLIVAGAVPLLIALCCVATTLQNLVTLLFPGWVHLGSDKQQGAAAFGQNMLTFFGQGLAALLCLLPAALLLAIIVAVQWFVFGVPIVAWEFPVFGIIVATPVLAAAALIVHAGGRVWDNLDPSREILAGSG
ncbi:MAG: hypothetical protein ACYTFT_09300, partial [Planctomycetota bacterium]|jgi:hypothetical protein